MTAEKSRVCQDEFIPSSEPYSPHTKSIAALPTCFPVKIEVWKVSINMW